MQQIIDKFQSFRASADALFNSLGAIDVARDGCFHGANRGALARQMVALSRQKKIDDASVLLDILRKIYCAVEKEIAGGLPGNCRNELIETLVENWK